MNERKAAAKKVTHGYGGIPHLSTSKLTQQADKKIHPGQEDILTKKVRDWRDLIVVTEKVDGSNVGITNVGGTTVAVGRSGYPATSSPFRQHHLFANFVERNEYRFRFLPHEWTLRGEWCAQAHGTKYDVSKESPFVAFDLISPNKERVPYLDLVRLSAKYGFALVPLLHIGQPIKIKNAINLLGDGRYGKPDKPEGVVYRCERDGKVEFLAKWVRGDKEDGKYMEQEIFNVGFYPSENEQPEEGG